MHTNRNCIFAPHTHAHAHVGRLTSGSLHVTSGPLWEKAPLKKGSFPQRDIHTHAHARVGRLTSGSLYPRFREHVGVFTIGGLHPMSGPISGTAPLKEASFPQRDGTFGTLDAGYNIYALTYTTHTHPICVYVVSHLRAIVRPRIGRGSLPPPLFPLPCPCQFFWESEAETRRLWSVYDSKSPSKVQAFDGAYES